MKLKRKTPSGLFPSPYKTKYTRYPIHFYISNENPFQKREGSRKSVFLEEEADYLLPLPAVPFEISEWKTATVQLNYHIQVDKMNYSVPYEYVGKRVEVRMTKNIIEVFYKGTRISSHRRLSGRKSGYIDGTKLLVAGV